MRKEEELLMKEDCWELRATTEYARRLHPSLFSYIAHHCPIAEAWRYWWMPIAIDTMCAECSETPPSDMLGLWKLHNFNYIQEDA
jgi:hypothetical protein